jgi:Transposase.
MLILYQRCAAIDIGKDVIAVAVRLPGDGAEHRQTIKQTFKTFYGVLKHAARWLTEQQVTHVAMEATGIYSMPVYHALIEHGQFEKVLVCNAGHVRNVPGRKTDLSDAEWLVHLLECGLLRGSFIPPAQIKAARDVIRYRTKLTESRTSELQRLGNSFKTRGSRSIRWPRRSPPSRCGRWWKHSSMASAAHWCSPSWPKARCGRRFLTCNGRWKAASMTTTH